MPATASVEASPRKQQSAEPNTETAEPGSDAGPVVIRSDEDEELLDDDSENDSEDWRISAATVRLFRFKPGLWLSAEIPPPLLSDITNFPYAVREDLVECVCSALSSKSNFKLVHGEELPAVRSENEPPVDAGNGDSLRHILANAFCLTETRDTIEATSDSILPRFLWYRLELEKLYGADYVKESIVDERSGFKPKMNEIDLIEERKGDTGDGLEAPGSHDISSVDITQETPVVDSAISGTDMESAIESMGPEAVGSQQSPVMFSKKKRRKVQLTFQPIANNASSLENPVPPSTITDRTDPFSMALKEIQFRLSRHGTVGDPRDYFGKGESLMDKDDPFIDDEEMMAEIGLSKEDLEADDRSDEENDSGSEMSEAGDEEGDEYENTEDRFFIDNDSEPDISTETLVEEDKEETAKKNKEKKLKETVSARSIKQVDFAKPASLPLVYNPKAWRQAKSKVDIPPLAILFFFNLECLLSAKRLPILQRQLFDTVEFCIAEDKTVRLNAQGEALCRDFIGKIFQGAFSTFLVPFAPMTDLAGYSDVQMPRHSKIFLARHGEGSEVKASFVRDFVDSDVGMADVVYEVIKNHITPYGPTLNETKQLWWTAVTIHTLRVFARKEDTLVIDLDDFFQRHRFEVDWSRLMTKISEYTTRARSSKKINGNEKPLKTSEEMQAELEEENLFKIFDPIAPSIVDFAVSFNQKRNILRDVYEAGELTLVKLCCMGGYSENETVSDAVETTKLERALNLTWINRCLSLVEDSSSRILSLPLKMTPLWLEHRFRKFRVMLRVSTIHDRRKQRTLKIIKEERKKEPTPSTQIKKSVGPKTSNSPPSQPIKRKRDSGPTISTAGLGRVADSSSFSSAPAPKKKRLASPQNLPAPPPPSDRRLQSSAPLEPILTRSIVGALFKYHDISRVFFMLQASPLLLPLKVKLSFSQAPNAAASNHDEDVVMLSVVAKEYQCSLHSIDSWESQHLVIDVDGMMHTFQSLQEGLEFMEARFKKHCQTNSAVTIDGVNCRGWQAFCIAPESFDLGRSPSSRSPPRPTSGSAPGVCLLDFVLMHVWLNCHSGIENENLLTNLVFSDGAEMGPPHWISLPKRITHLVARSKEDYVPLKPSGHFVELERYKSGQLSFLSLFVKLTNNMITNGLSLPVRSSSFDVLQPP
eukprot:Gregarina_sp_Poly_1__642@NODE_1151_length_4930_cov_86_225787_g249_i1_p1_GENE_NODE_1151_length_4930_cov_86_225787_g249_i1NODE_1151_length_4930_cov_86_225787_g249_i1_p1_ORF_typecomplete_len1160_score214_98HUN/PF08729_10/1_8e04HUN/PF08729_10/0_012HUN/PF08729_10/3_9e03_NODE_1151_length_4930_cov_86_225787_g249_i15814060